MTATTVAEGNTVDGKGGLQLDIPTMDDTAERAIQPQRHAATPLSPASQDHQRRIRFNELCSLIPEIDEQQSEAKNATNQGRPRLSSRTYSLTLPGLFSHHQEQVPGMSTMRDEDGFMPSSAPRLNLKLPTLTRRRRSSTSAMHCSSSTRAPLKSCLKTPTDGCLAKTTSIDSNVLSPLKPALRVNTDYFNSQGSLKSPHKQRKSEERSPVFSASSSTAELESKCEKIPLSPCCSNCYKGADYGLLPPTPSDVQNPHGCTDMYFERWSKQARIKRQKDKEWAAQCGRHIELDPAVVKLDATSLASPTKSAPCTLPSITETVDEVDVIRRSRSRASSPAVAEESRDVVAEEPLLKPSPTEPVQQAAPVESKPTISRTQSHNHVAPRRPEAKRTLSNNEQRRASPHTPRAESSTAHWTRWIAGMSGATMAH